MAVILRYFSEFAYLPCVLRKSSRSISHLLMSSCKIGDKVVGQKEEVPLLSRLGCLGSMNCGVRVSTS